MRKNILAILLSAGPAFAQVPAEIARSIANLGSPDFRIREAASDKLCALGAPALQPLQDSLVTGNPEGNRRAELLMAQIRQRLSDEAAIAPKIVSIKMSNAKLSDIFDELRKQTTYEFRLNGDSTLLSKEVSFDTGGKVPLWAAMAKLCEIAGLDVEGASAPQGPLNLAPVKVPQPTLSGEEQILKEFREQKLQKLEVQNTVLLAQRVELAKALVNAGKNDRVQIQKRLAEIENELKAMSRQIAALKELLAGKHEMPSPTGTIALKARGVEKPNPIAFTGAVRIEATPVTNPSAYAVNQLPVLSAYSVNQLPVRLKFTPEPGMRWVNVVEIIATKATDSDGRELKHDHDSQLYAQSNPANSPGLDIRSNYSGTLRLAKPTHEAGFALLVPRGGKSTKLAQVEGLIRANVWSVPEEILSVRGFDIESGAIEDSNGAAMLSAKLVANPANPHSPYLDVILSYDIGRVKPRTTGASEESAPAWLGQGQQGQAVLIKPAGAKTSREPLRNDHGLSLTDADGKAFSLNLNSSETTQYSGMDGETTIRFTGKFRYTFRPVGTEVNGAPAKLSFHGTRMKSVSFPFALKDVPVAPGTASVDTVEKTRPPAMPYTK
jgi:hypothetical protein